MNQWLHEVNEFKQYLVVDENDLLREKCTNEQLLNELIHTGEKILWDKTDEDRSELFGALGNLYRIKGDLKIALPYLERYKDYMIQKKEEDRAIVAIIRFAEALKYDHQYDLALALFEEALERCIILKLHKYENYAWQNLGKCYVEMGEMKQAENCFIKAHILRKEIGDPVLLQASERALNFIMNIKK